MAWFLSWRAAAAAATSTPAVSSTSTTPRLQTSSPPDCPGLSSKLESRCSAPPPAASAADAPQEWMCGGDVPVSKTDGRDFPPPGTADFASPVCQAALAEDTTSTRAATGEAAVRHEHMSSTHLVHLHTARYKWMTQNVPSTAPEALRIFFSRPAILTCLLLASLALALRVSLYPRALADVPVALAVALWWVLQEWIIHAKLLHSTCAWWGKEIHIAHHKMPYHHISIDGFKVVGTTMVLAFLTFRTIFQDDSLLLTSLATYFFMGLAYEWTHFLVHTKVPMRSYAAKIIKRAHVKHHLRDENFWFSFTCPPLDNLMGTTPDPWLIG